MRTKPYSLIPLLLIGACLQDAGPDARTYLTRDSAGIRVVESRMGAWTSPRAIEAEPILEIGREEEGPYQFAFPVQALLLEDGRVAVAEASAQEVRVFDSAGSHLRTLGRRGEGPGEFLGMGGLFRYSTDSVAAYDGRLRRTTIFDTRSGAFRTVANGVEGNYFVFGRVWNGPLLLYNPGSGYRPDLNPGLQWVVTDVVALDPHDGSFRAVAQLAQREQFVEADGDTRPVVPLRFAVQAAAEGGFYWGTPERYEIVFYDVNGLKRRIIRRPIEAPEVQQEEIDAYIQGELERVRRFEGEAAVPRYRRTYEEASYGDQVPLFGTAFVDGAQQLWVSGPLWPSFEEPPRNWSLFSEEGVWLGDLRAPDRFRVLDSDGERVVGIWTNEFDVPHVRVHRMVPG